MGQETCFSCGGSGRIATTDSNFKTVYQSCGACNGSGWVPTIDPAPKQYKSAKDKGCFTANTRIKYTLRMEMYLQLVCWG